MAHKVIIGSKYVRPWFVTRESDGRFSALNAPMSTGEFKLQKSLLDNPICCNGNCAQGDDCPLRDKPVREELKPWGYLFLVTGILLAAAVVAFAHG